MRILIVLLIGLLLGPFPAHGQDSMDVFLKVLNRELGGARMAEPPVVEGRRSPIGPQLYRKVVDSVLLIVTTEAIGSGVVVSPKGHVLTNWHVVGEHKTVAAVPRNRDLLKGIQHLKEEHLSLARLVAVDQRRDLALLLITGPRPGMRHVPLGESDGVEVGQDVYAIGHPKNFLWTYTEGVVSQIRPDYQWMFKEGTTHQATVIQTQTPMHTGSSGGALFDGDARVVGIVTGQKDPTLNLAIAVSEVRDWIQSLARR